MSYKIINKSKGTVIVNNAVVAKTFLQRLMGLLGRKSIDKDEALIFYSAESIHMFFMRFSIDVVFLDKNMRVIKISANLKPWMMTGCFPSAITIELSSAKCAQTQTSVGDVLEFIA